MSNEIQGKCYSKEEFLTEKHELNMQLDESSKKMNALRVQKSGILGQVRYCVAVSPLIERMKLMEEIADLERNKPKVSEYNKEEQEMKGFDPCLLLKDACTDGCSD